MNEIITLLPTIVFYLFSGVTVLCALAVVSSKNPVHSVFFLILAFFSAAGLFVLLGAEYIAMTLVIVYVGAVAVLFLFVVMMLDINFAELRQGFMKYLPLGAAVALTIFIELVLVITMSLSGSALVAEARNPIMPPQDITNTEAIGAVLYTQYAYAFQLAGLVLLVAMIGAITLTLRSRPGVRKQVIAKQLARTREQGMEVVKVTSGEGIK
jgi:NADH-quinone oxidoreductase subunit J